jgi:NAD(P)H-dependent nitrite reductase small subunit
MGEFVTVATITELPVDRGVAVSVAGCDIALFKLGAEVFAIDNTCPHRGGPLSAGYTEGDFVYCPLHGWKFDIKTGKCLENLDKPVRSYAVRLLEGQVQIEIDV